MNDTDLVKYRDLAKVASIAVDGRIKELGNALSATLDAYCSTKADLDLERMSEKAALESECQRLRQVNQELVDRIGELEA